MGEPARQVVIAGKYELIGEIGRGGMGSVWRAHALALDVPCAIKFLLPEHASTAGAHERFVREARAAARLRSENVVGIYDVDTWEGSPFIAMELLHGENLEQRLSRDKRLTPTLTLEIVRQVGRGLVKAHANGLVHRDLKPENIFLVEDESVLVKILDFGVVKSIDAPPELKTQSGMILGTPHYMSPEQASGVELDARSDLWSLAVVAYRCLTGRFPFDGDSLPPLLMNLMYAPLPKPRDHQPELPEALDAWWLRAASRDPAGRFQSAAELVRELERALAVSNVYAGEEPEHASLLAPPGASGRRKLALAAVLALGLALGMGWGFAALGGTVAPTEQAPREDEPSDDRWGF